ncbi:hypothetical protein Pla123a_47700 [Posidoniimonas polymericola]|uniref:Uncharacterized protein n=1 Tax=Posidoniimonas polymericola TaxID=2528002 RepID=A0A5C5XSL7_9BACT|nr:hypothetical protein [Posidoniimonas polymericola]TWT66246.1 hypothetical protein Pla123a_47700 [Posidoniimonas polymericola]
MRKRIHRSSIAGVVLAHILAAACGCSQGPETVTVTGSVTLDGSPLDDARIEFDSGDGAPPESLVVTSGAFSGNVVVGTKTVRFFALRPSKPNPMLSPTDVQNPFENILPDRYGYDSAITIDLSVDDPTNLSYELESKR